MRTPTGLLKNLPLALVAAAALLLVLGRPAALPAYAPELLAGLGVALFFAQVYRASQHSRVLTRLRARWGKADERERDFDALNARYHTCRPGERDLDSIDDATWADLNMNEVFDAMDRTHTNAGELMLYVLLRSIVNSPETLEARRRALKKLAEDTALLDALLLRLDRLGRDSLVDLTELLWGAKPARLPHGWAYKILAGCAALSLLAFIPLGLSALGFVIFPVFVINGLLTMVIVRGDVLAQLRTLRYLGKVIGAARALSTLEGAELAPWTAELDRASKATMGIARRIRLLNPEGGVSAELFDSFAYYASMFFLVEVRTFNRVMADVARLNGDLRTVLQLTGELDALQSVASFRTGLAHYCEPEFVTGPSRLRIDDGWHPLLSDPVPNSIRCEGENLFITGSNMAGKSTFLRMVALNIVLAQTVYTCCARGYRATPFRLTSSISHSDDIASGASYFMAEALRLLHVVKCAAEPGTPFLCLVDEMLRGTNSVERHAASLAVLKRLACSPALIVVASHDTELGQMLDGKYRLHHFAESFNEDRMLFDYQLKPGVCAAGNAIRTLSYIGFPDAVIEEAREHLAQIQSNGGVFRSSPDGNS